MNKIIIIIAMLFSQFLIGKECVSSKEYIHYYFLNGVNVNKQESLDSSELVNERLKLKSKVIALHNPTYYEGGFEKKMKSETGIVSFGYGVLHFGSKIVAVLVGDVIMEVLPQKVVELGIESARYKVPESKISDFLKKTKTYDLVNKYIPLLSSKESNIVFAHSQGNLVANELCQNKGNIDMEIISIASPAGVLPCNKFQTYALYNFDFVILPLKQSYPNFIYLDSNFVGYDHLLDGYLSNKKVVDYLGENLTKTKEHILDRDLKFDFLSLSMKENTKYVAESNIGYKENQERKVSVAKRLVKSKQIGYQFGLILLDETFKIDYHKQSVAQRNKEYTKAILDIPINARSDQEMKDFLVYMKKEILSFCKDPRRPKMDEKFSFKVCDYLKGVTVQNSKTENSYEGMSLNAFSQDHVQELKLSCKDVKVGKYDIMLNYKPHSTMEQEISLNVNGKESIVKVPKQENTSQVSRFIAQASIEQDDNNGFSLKMSDVVTKITPSRELATTDTPESAIKSGEINYRSCYTFRLLGSPECDVYVDRLFGRE